MHNARTYMKVTQLYIGPESDDNEVQTTFLENTPVKKIMYGQYFSTYVDKGLLKYKCN